MGKAFKSKAGKQYGMTEVDMILKRSNSKSTFGSLRDAMRDVDVRATNAMPKKFLRRQIDL